MPKQIFFTVQPRGNHFRVIDQEGYAIGSNYTRRESAQSYANALNMARNCNQSEPEIELQVGATTDTAQLVERHQRFAKPQPPTPPARPSLLARLTALAAKAREYKFVRIGL
jgi:hypothetical protein